MQLDPTPLVHPPPGSSTTTPRDEYSVLTNKERIGSRDTILKLSMKPSLPKMSFIICTTGVVPITKKLPYVEPGQKVTYL